MKTIKIFSIIVFCTAFSVPSMAQKNVSETIKVSGNCGMCKTKIEKAAKTAGASFAEWDVDTKILSVKYSSKSTNSAKIQDAIAATGYDTEAKKATDEAYNNLHSCCKYERAGKASMDCCKDGKCTKEGHDGKDCCKEKGHDKMDCCKDGKCTKEGHAGKECCRKS